MSSTPAAVLRLPVDESYRYCREVARKRAKNFYYSFILLEKPKRDAMCAIYAFMRRCDDLSDNPSIKNTAQMRGGLVEWRAQLIEALQRLERPGPDQVAADPIWPAFTDTVRRYSIPHNYFHEMIDGVLSDLDARQPQTFDELYRYCYHVASVVGLVVIHIFGFRSPQALVLAEKCGIAFQLTNILRDIREDAAMGRIYIPMEDLGRFQVPAEQLRSGVEDNRFRELMRFEAARARSYYDESAPLLNLVEPTSRRSLWALRGIYLRLLSKIEGSNYSVLSRRISVKTPMKIAVLMWASIVK